MEAKPRRRAVQATLVLAACAALARGNPASADHTIVLPAITVEETRPIGLTTRSLEEAREELEHVPGGTTLIEAEEFRGGPTSNLEDVLSFTPGVYAQDRFGGPETRLSIRGSGISQPFAVKGVRLLRNGLPITEADGDFHSQFIEPMTARYVEVYRGANALEYGASTLGGAINFITHTGYTAPTLNTRLEVGSNGFLRPFVSGGAVLGESWDVYASLSGSYLDGFRDHSETDNTSFYGNVGYRFSERAESRLHVSVDDINQQLPGGLTQAELEDDPTQASDFFQSFNSQNDFSRYRADLQHTWLTGDRNRLDFGAFYEQQYIDHPLPFGIFDEDQVNTGLSLRQELRGRAFARDNRFVWGGILAVGDIENDVFEAIGGGARGPLLVTEKSDVLTAELFAEDQLQLTEQLVLALGAQAGFAERETLFDAPAPATDNNIEEDYFGVSPKLGLIWQVTEHAQVFGNVSRSFEPPIIAEFNDTTAGVLDEQTATTVEIGTRGGAPRFGWDLAVYHSWLRDEVLTVEVPPLPSGEFATSNADKTTHSGVELGVEARLPLAVTGDDLAVRATYTYNRFRFDDDPAFGDNQIPGIPRHFGRVEALYEQESGFYIGPHVQAASGYFVDYTNTLEADSFVIVGARVGYKRDDRWSVFVEAHNLGDEEYISDTSPVADAAGQDTAAFNPGLDRSVFAGVDIAW